MTRVAVVGCGVIGVGWARLFLAHGLDVTAVDPAEDAEQRLRADLADVDTARLSFTDDVAEAVADADFVQENGPERIDVKHAVFAAMDAAARPGVVLASSSSGLLPTRIAAMCAHPERVLVGHPFHPADLIPLVEVVPGERTAPETVDRAVAFYTSVGKSPVRLEREVPGYVANRLQAALWREAYSLVDQGVASVADIDRALSTGPGLRWALLGPFLNQHLSGGRGGLAHVLEHLGPPTEEWWRTMTTPEMTEELKARLVAGVDDEVAGRDLAALVARRDTVLRGLLAAKTDADL